MEKPIYNMPFPEHARRGAKPKYPWREIQPGGAFKFPHGVTMSTAASLAYVSGRQLAMKFAVRKVGEEIWCWRIDGTPHERTNGNYRQQIAVVDNYQLTPADETIVTGYGPGEPNIEPQPMPPRHRTTAPVLDLDEDKPFTDADMAARLRDPGEI